MENIGELIQLDISSSRSWFFHVGKDLVIACMDDYSRKILAVHLFTSDDVFCLTEKRHLRKDNTFSYNGTTYTLGKNRRTTTPKAQVELHIHPGIKIRAFYEGEFIQEFPFIK